MCYQNPLFSESRDSNSGEITEEKEGKFQLETKDNRFVDTTLEKMIFTLRSINNTTHDFASARKEQNKLAGVS